MEVPKTRRVNVFVVNAFDDQNVHDTRQLMKNIRSLSIEICCAISDTVLGYSCRFATAPIRYITLKPNQLLYQLYIHLITQ